MGQRCDGFMIGRHVRIKSPELHWSDVSSKAFVYGTITNISKRPIINSCSKCGEKACSCDWYIIQPIYPGIWFPEMAFQRRMFRVMTKREVEIAQIMQV
jgi:hypothetical protein